MNSPKLSRNRVKRLLTAAAKARVLVIGDLMLDQFIWGRVSRISPEAPVPVLDFERESFMPGGAANVARNLSALGANVSLIGVAGHDHPATQLQALLKENLVNCDGIVQSAKRSTTIKTRIVAHQQQVVRVDRETREELDDAVTERVLAAIEGKLREVEGVIIGDYGKGLVTQRIVNQVKQWCRARGLWLSLDPKPVHALDLAGLSLITPNRKEAFQLAGITDGFSAVNPLKDPHVMQAANKLLHDLQPALLLITLGEQGMLLCQRGQKPFHIPTVAREVFDVSGAGDTVIASFTLAVLTGASPIEAAIFSNHAAGVVVGKVGTATVSPGELLASFGS